MGQLLLIEGLLWCCIGILWFRLPNRLRDMCLCFHADHIHHRFLRRNQNLQSHLPGQHSTYCGTGCQTEFGTCGTVQPSASHSTSSYSSTSPSFPTSSSTRTSISSSTSSSSSDILQPSKATKATHLSTGAKAGIGIGVAVLGVLITVLLAWWLIRRRSRHGYQGSPNVDADENVIYAKKYGARRLFRVGHRKQKGECAFK
jgi:hypothetical protein